MNIFYSFENLEKDLKQIQEQCSRHIFPIIIGINRGGIIPAAHLGYKLGCDHILSLIPNRLDSIQQTIDFVKTSKIHSVLLMDDICDSGVTFHYITRLLEQPLTSNGIQLFTAALIENTEQKLHSLDFRGQIIERSKQPLWYDFFWEKSQ